MANSNFTNPGDPFSAADTKPANVCKYLGVKDDPQTFFYYASTWNHCHRPQNSVAVSPAHQSEFCLCDQHTRCPVFQANWKGEFPKELLVSSGTRRSTGAVSLPGSSNRRVFGCGIIAVALVGLIFLTAFMLRSGNNGPGGSTNTPAAAAVDGSGEATETATEEPSATPAPTSTATNTPEPTNTPTPTDTPEPTNTPLPTPGAGLETPFGPNAGYIIHVVAPGESFTSISNNYSTTPEVLQAVNPTIQGVSLWVGRQIVVPIGLQDATDLPVFVIVFTTEPITVTDLAATYQTDAAEIQFYNQLGPDPLIPSGRWLIIPVPPES